jgi:hypothetical protein
MNALCTHLDDLLTVLRVSAELSPSDYAPIQLRNTLAAALVAGRPELARRVARLDDWHTEALADFVVEAHVLAEAFDRWPRDADPAGDTKIG